MVVHQVIFAVWAVLRRVAIRLCYARANARNVGLPHRPSRDDTRDSMLGYGGMTTTFVLATARAASGV
jgi:hypothetical protein